uniref:Uncharacterized protein n=1 Tax=Periophthalmus magnuspinnatus TaxID=409849 RepID=A0A3B4BHF7_9GOBI
MKITLLLLNPRFDYRSNSPLLYPGIDLTGKAEECDSPVIGIHPPVSLLIQRDHHPGLPIQWHCPRPPRDVAETCQPRHPRNIQRHEVIGTDLVHPRSLTHVPQSVLQRLEASLSVVPDEEQEPGDYAPEPGSPQGVGSRGTESDVPSQRSQLLDLLLSARRSSSGCFGARMDRIGNASGLGCGRGQRWRTALDPVQVRYKLKSLLKERM